MTDASQTHDDALLRDPELRPLAVVVLAVWQDQHLSPSELLGVRELLERAPELGAEARAALAAWLDPSRPPSAGALGRLARKVTGWVEDCDADGGPGSACHRSLSALAEAVASGAGVDLNAPQTRSFLSALAPVDDFVPPPAFASRTKSPGARKVGPQGAGRSTHVPGQGGSSAAAAIRSGRESELPVAALRARLDGDFAETRDFIRQLLNDPVFRSQRGLDTAAERAQTLAWLRELLQRGVLRHCYPDGFTAGRDLGRFAAAFECIAMFDLSLVVKFGVQAGLFAGAVEMLGTERHHETLERALGGDLLGCFAMTERGHGSDVRSLRTTATYDRERDAFLIHTGDLSAGKEWIGNAADDGRMAVVFAQLTAAGEERGIHALLVPIREADGRPKTGVRIEDCGTKMGLNGVDNGRLWFEQVEVPRSALLDRFGRVTDDGEYESQIPSAGKRFFTMLSTLVGGRIAVAGAANTAAKVGLTIALRYAAARTQFERPGDPEGRERPILEYASTRQRLMPQLAAAYAFTFAQQALVRAAVEATRAEPTEHDVDTLAAGLKALGTWRAIDSLQLCRECCGGQGYLSANRIDALRTDTDVFVTFEGDNTVLLSLVAGNLMRRYQKRFSQAPVRTVFKSVYEDVVSAVTDRNPFAQRDVSEDTLRSLDFHASALAFRERSLRTSLAKRIKKRTDEGLSATQAFDACQDHALALARAHIELFVLASFERAVEEEPALAPLCALYGLDRLSADLAWFLENDFLAASKSRAVRKTLRALCDELSGDALALADAFAIPDPCLGPLADPDYLATSGLA